MITFYKIRRDICNETKFFRVNVPEAGHYGFGVQLRFGAVVVGFSIVRVRIKRKASENEHSIN